MRFSRSRSRSFSTEFLLVSLVSLLGGMTVIGIWLQAEIERAVINRTAGVTALFVDSFVSPHLQELADGDELSAESRAELERLLRGTPLGQEVVSFKVWDRGGTVLFSPNEEIVGKSFAADRELIRAFEGEVISAIADLTEAENAFEARRWDSLIETYAPVRLEGSGQTIAVSEFYQIPDSLLSDIRAAQLRSWGIIAGATVLMYLLLVGIVRRASNLIAAQRSELEDNVDRITETSQENKDLREKVQRAALRTTALNERYLRRISADIHDGPAQNVALALLRVESIADGIQASSNGENATDADRDLSTIQTALSNAMDDLRAVARGLRMPELDELSPAETAEKAIDEYRRVSGSDVELTVTDAPMSAPLPTKITLYRVLQEALSNASKHAQVDTSAVLMAGSPHEITLVVSDDGVGFDTTFGAMSATLGLAGMRERVQLLGGTFNVSSAPGSGTTITARLPLTLPEAEYV